MDIEVEKQDKRKWHHEPVEYEPVTSDLFEANGVILHDYQVDLANLALEQRRGVIKCATGGGKTMIFTALLRALKERYPAMMICRNKTVVNQTYESFRRAGLQNVGRVHMDYTEPDIITCITSQSLHKVPELIPRTRVLLVDECHEWASKHSQRHLKLFENTIYRLGFSATPWNGDPVHDMKLKSWIGPELCDVGIDYLRDQKILSSCHAHFYRVPVPTHRVSSALPSQLSPKELKEIISSRTFFDSDQLGIVENEHLQNKIVEIVSNIPEGRILILVRRLPHGDRLKALMPDAHWIRGEDTAETREHVLEQLRQSDRTKVVAIMSAIGFYGLNVLCHHLINACGGKDANLLIQKVGRGLRKGIDKEHLEYHDFLFEGDRFLQRHSKTRIEVLQSEGHQVTVEPVLPRHAPL
jgi:superfamily II DNA or RNA helicase